MGKMEPTITIPNDKALEFLTALFFVLDLCMIYIFGRYCFRKLRIAEPRALIGSIGLILLFIGLALTRGWIWWFRHQWNHGHDVAMDGTYFSVYAVALTISGAGLIMCLRAFFVDWGARGWIFMLALVVAAAMTLTIM
jgi:hypothetical protein